MIALLKNTIKNKNYQQYNIFNEIFTLIEFYNLTNQTNVNYLFLQLKYFFLSQVVEHLFNLFTSLLKYNNIKRLDI